MGLLPKDIELLPAYDDRVFKLLMTSPHSTPTLLYVSSSIIKRPVSTVLVRNNELPSTDTEEKAERLDVNCKIDDDTQADIEMQYRHMKEDSGGNYSNLKARSLFYLCDLHSTQSSKGKSFDSLPKTYQVMFCRYTVFPEREEFVNQFSMRHDLDNELLHDGIRSVFVEFSKLKDVLKKPVEEMTDMERVSVFLRYAASPKHREIVNRVIESREGLSVAGELLMSISKDERERAIFRSRRMYQADKESDMIVAKRAGRAEGMSDVAKRLLVRNRPIDEIAEVTGLTHAEVEALRNIN
jgi:predicted transposase/invertase (TIGR01784 family)